MAKRDGKKYYLVNEKYTSMLYLNATSILPIQLNKENPGYMSYNKIIGAGEAANPLRFRVLPDGYNGHSFLQKERSRVSYILRLCIRQ